MNTALVSPFLALTAVSLGLRATSLLASRLHPIGRMAAALVVGAIFTITALQLSDRYMVHDLGLGFLVSLAPVGVFDLLKWWYRWGK
jgi:hypothetical protein